MTTSFWHMGGYAVYVWTAYGVVAAVLGAELLQLATRRRALLKRLKAMRDIETD